MERNETEKLIVELKTWIPCVWNQYVKYRDLYFRLGDEHFFSHQNHLCNIFDDITNYLEYIKTECFKEGRDDIVDINQESISSLMNMVFDEMARIHKILSHGGEDADLVLFEEKRLGELHNSLNGYLQFLVENHFCKR